MANGDFGDLVFYQPIKAWTPLATGSSEAVISIEPTTPNSASNTFQPMMTMKEIDAQINMNLPAHKRPMADSEYDEFITTLKTGKNANGEQVFKYEMAAIAQVVKENYKSFFPATTIDPIVESRIQEAVDDLDIAFRNKYMETVQKYRDHFVTDTAEEKFELYSPDEKKRLRNTGIAFLEYKTNGDTVDAETPVTMTPSKARGQSQFNHPMLKYGLIKVK